jgi:hypothetical protein
MEILLAAKGLLGVASLKHRFVFHPITNDLELYVQKKKLPLVISRCYNVQEREKMSTCALHLT